MGLIKALKKLEKYGLIYYELEDYNYNRRHFSRDTVKSDGKRSLKWYITILFLIFAFVTGSGVTLKEDVSVKEAKVREYFKLLEAGNFPEAITMLEESPFLLNMQDSYGWSAIHWSEFYGKKRFSGILKKKGINQELKTEKRWFVYGVGLRSRDIISLDSESEKR